jgi:phosphatidylglycerophosphate synthase
MKSYELKDQNPVDEAFRRMGCGFVEFLVAHYVHPNTVSYLSLFFSFLAGAMLAFSTCFEPLLYTAPFFFFFRLYCNTVDGMVATQSGMRSEKCAVLSELPDRISDTLIFIGLALSGLANAYLTFAIIFGMLFCGYVGALGKAMGVRRQFGGLMGKQQRMFVLALGCWVQVLVHRPVDPYFELSVLDVACGVIAAGLVQTVITRTRTLFRELTIGV